MKESVDFIILLIIYILFLYKKWKTKGVHHLIFNTTMYIYLSFVLYFTLMPIITNLPYIFNHPYTPINFVPFIDVLNGRGDFTRQIILNIIMTMPFGFLLPLTSTTKINLSKTILYTFLLSTTIELLQPLINGARTADITDIITNIIGGIIGYIIYNILKPLINKIIKLFNC